MNTSIRILAAALMLLGAVACAEKQTRYEDPGIVETIDPGFGSTDLNQIAQSMTDSFVGSGEWGSERPRIVVGNVRNRTTEHIDTENITDSIRTALIQSGKFSVLAGNDGIGQINKETAYQEGGWVDDANAVETGKQLGAEYILYGRFTEIQKRTENIQSRYFKFTLNAVNVQSRQITWADEHQIMKVEEEGGVGW